MPATAYWYAYWYALLVRFTGTLYWYAFFWYAFFCKKALAVAAVAPSYFNK